MRTRTPALAIFLLAAMVAGCQRDAPDEAARQTTGKPAAEAASDVPGVTADADTQRGLHLELAAVNEASVNAQIQGTATVVDPAAFATAMADLDSLRSEAAVAADNERRIENLYHDDGNASRQSLDTARQQDSSLHARLTGAESRARLDWGDKLAHPTDAAAAKLRADIVRGAVTLFRAEFPQSLGSASSLKYELRSSRHESVNVDYLDRSLAVAQFAAGDSVLLGLRTSASPDAAFRAGERVPVVATSTGAAQLRVPAEAAIAYQGRLWCYVARPSDRFERIELEGDASGAQGYAVPGGLQPGDRVVVRGAALLLSLERSAGAEAAPSED